ncbi:uncharacterized protein LOC111884759 [Lactuca sativa]|nr:uncharacterized protein LOC111884759 [Lactuca sativa]
MSDDATRSLTNTSVQEMLNKHPDDTKKVLPSTIEQLKGSTRNMFIECSKSSSSNNILPIITKLTTCEILENPAISPLTTTVTPTTTKHTGINNKDETTPKKSRKTGKRLPLGPTVDVPKTSPQKQKKKNKEQG